MAFSNFAFLSAFISLALGEISSEILEWVRFKFFGDGVLIGVDVNGGWSALIV